MTNARLTTIAVAGMALLTIVLLGLVLATSYSQSRRLVDAQRSACERGKLDRSVNALGWRTAQQARLASGAPNDLIAAARYDKIAGSLEQRARIDCASAFPAPAFFQLGN